MHLLIVKDSSTFDFSGLLDLQVTFDEVANIPKAIEFLSGQNQYDCALIDGNALDPTGDFSIAAIKEAGIGTPLCVFREVTVDQPEKMVQDLEAGADQSLSLDLSLLVIMRYVKTVVERNHLKPEDALDIGGGFVLDSEKVRFRYNSEFLDLSTARWHIVRYLAERCDTICSREELLEVMQSDNRRKILPTTVDKHISEIRQKMTAAMQQDYPDKKLEELGGGLNSGIIQTVKGQGYKMLSSERIEAILNEQGNESSADFHRLRPSRPLAFNP